MDSTPPPHGGPLSPARHTAGQALHQRLISPASGSARVVRRPASWLREAATSQTPGVQTDPVAVETGNKFKPPDFLGRNPRPQEGSPLGSPWSRWSGLNRRPTVYETVALPLSYTGEARCATHAIGKGELPAGASGKFACARFSAFLTDEAQDAEDWLAIQAAPRVLRRPTAGRKAVPRLWTHSVPEVASGSRRSRRLHRICVGKLSRN